MQIIRLYTDTTDLGYFKEWSDNGCPVLTSFETQACKFRSIELAERTAKWAVQMGHYHRKFSKYTQYKLIPSTSGTNQSE